jgi:hypothetical protein
MVSQGWAAWEALVQTSDVAHEDMNDQVIDFALPGISVAFRLRVGREMRKETLQ